MKARVYHDYGTPDVLKCEDVEMPSPKENQVLLRVRAPAVNPLDCGLMSLAKSVQFVRIGLKDWVTPNETDEVQETRRHETWSA